jgi:hypothetical protein
MKIATHVLVFGQEKWIMRNLENAYPHVDRIYMSMSYDPWTYNAQARGKYKNTFHANLTLSPAFDKYRDKLVVISANYDTEEQQRNDCVDQAIRDGMDYLIIHDADEFYFHRDFPWIKKYIEENPDYDYYNIAWYCFWKSFKNILLDSTGNKIAGYPEFAINLKRGVRFQSKRRPNKSNSNIIPPYIGICYHGSYVLTNEELLQKINTWGHTNDFNKEYWYNNIWLKWTPEMRDLHLVSPSAWSQAVEFNGELPEVIRDLK